MKHNKRLSKSIKKAMFIAIVFIVLFTGIPLLVNQTDNNQSSGQTDSFISDNVKAYRPLVEKYAKQFGIEKHVDTILAIMMQESGGRGDDPMQASESYCGKRNCIKDPEISIKQGIYYFSQTLNDADEDLLVAVQAYNFGRGFINYLNEQGKGFSQEAAIHFSQEMYANDPDKEKYRCLRDGARELDACYGDIYYVKSVMAYRDELKQEK